MSHQLKRRLQFSLRYLGNPPWETGASPPELIYFLEHSEPGRALDVGCGTGTNLLTMTEFDWRVVGVDIIWLSVCRARKKFRHADVEGDILQGDVASDLELEGAFDLVLDMGCFHSLSSRGRGNYRENLKRWLKVGGTYLLYAHRRTSSGSSHGISEEDLAAFSQFLTLIWRKDDAEKRPDGSGGRPSSWLRFDRLA